MVTLVLLPGMDGSGELLDEFVGALAPESAPIVIRYKSGAPQSYEDLEALVIEALPKEREFILLCESFSGPVGVAVAAKRPVGLVALVLACSFVRAPWALPGPVRTFVAVVPFWRLPVWLGAGLVLGRSNSAAFRTRLDSAVRMVSAAVWRARLRAVLEVDVSSKLTSVAVPVLYLRARNDRIVPRSAGELIKRSLPRLKLVEVNGPHFLLQACPVEAARAVRQFTEAEKIAF